MLQKPAIILLLLLIVPFLAGQDLPDTTLVRYSPDYEFRDGLYMNPGMVKANRPIPPARIISDRDKFDYEFYNVLLKKEYILLNDKQGVQTYIKPEQLWGYAYKGELYIQIERSFQRLILEGNISRFVASATTYDERASKQFDSGAYPSRYYYGPYRRRPPNSYATKSRGVYLLDFETNILYDDTPEDLEKILVRDSQLLLEYSALKRKERKKRLLEFIQRYNERHPLYLPAMKSD
ncbi:MAG: hypothetical protein U9R60_02350 [Bacteroidota bacterium]|nr:hypothetical protein [Bacteroidota bacterium]